MLNILIAYPYMSKQMIEMVEKHQDSIRLLMDSGAFTAWKSGKPIELKDYISFVKGLPFKPWRYFTLDVIGDAEASMENYKEMLTAGLNPIPIFTRGEKIEALEEYYKTSDVVGLGGLVGTKGNKEFVKGIMEVVGDRKVHWLGFNAKDFIAHYKPYTCDSSSWASAVRYASCKLYDKNGRWIQVKKEDFVKRPSKEILDLIRSYGIDPHLLSQVEEWKSSGHGKYALERLTFRSWTRYQIDLREKLGVEFFIALTTPAYLNQFVEAYNFWLERKKRGVF